MRTAAALRWMSLGLAAVAAACMQIDDIVQGECGNTVIDANEDCDTHDDHGMRCYPAGTEGKGCRYDCSGEKCTGGYACGADGICRAALGTFEPAFAEDEEAELLHVADFDGDGQLDICAVTADRESFVHYLGPDLRSEQTLRLPIGQLTRPATGSLTLADPANSADLALRGGPGGEASASCADVRIGRSHPPSTRRCRSRWRTRWPSPWTRMWIGTATSRCRW